MSPRGVIRHKRDCPDWRNRAEQTYHIAVILRLMQSHPERARFDRDLGDLTSHT
jgi:hypothetical protein